MRQGLKPHSIIKRPKHWGSRRHRLQRRPVTCHLLPLLMACDDIVPETRPTFTVPGVDRCWSWLVGTERCLPARDTTRDVHIVSHAFPLISAPADSGGANFDVRSLNPSFPSSCLVFPLLQRTRDGVAWVYFTHNSGGFAGATFTMSRFTRLYLRTPRPTVRFSYYALRTLHEAVTRTDVS